MPYYCTVPRCTSMAGKAKNVSFHQFPRDEELAKLWNDILKRGKPYTKYSKVCSLHFKPEDYTITSAGKNKGQWRTLRKDAIPSQNLPSDTPAPYQRKQSSAWMSNVPNNVPTLDPQVQQQLAQAIYMNTMLAMQAAGVTVPLNLNAICNGLQPLSTQDQPESLTTQTSPPQNESAETDHEKDTHSLQHEELHLNQKTTDNMSSYQCNDCSKCFKDPDVFLLHKRSHKTDKNGVQTGKENFDLNTLKPEMLKSNPILANLLKDTVEKNIFNTNIFEKQLMVSFSSMASYIGGVASNNYDNECDSSISDHYDDDNLVIDENVA
ncbi:unnamed protein product [Arctia plantaginis]|uniref:Uncharacterized protein n=1 Tax=Arctia plantaginis TaxID=874455 RepID=A0A8S1BKA5_ARCPL|nr:unnamed protein product [Arctia plantaginis]